MAAIPNRIVIGNDQENPIFTFENDEIISIDSDASVSLVGEELYVNQFSAVVDYYVWTPYVFKPTDYDGFLSSDSMLLATRKTYDIRTLPYGTKIVYYAGNDIAGVFYVKNVERLQRAHYKTNAVSAVGLMDRQYHNGGVYQGAYVQDVIEEILGQDFDYIIDGTVAVQTVYGWLPYGTKRDNLYQLLLAYGIEIVLGDNGSMFFKFPDVEAAQTIPADRVFQGGKVIYDEPASLVEVNEHSFFYDPDMTETVLFDNTAAVAADHTMVIFTEPIYPSSIYVETGTMTIHSAYANYAVVSGTGVVKGKPYVHNIRLISNSNPNAPVEKVVSVQDCTLVSFVTADNVLARLSEYYFNAQRVEQDIVVEGEKPGLRYATENPYGELMTGYISRMTKSVTSFARAKCRFIVNYEPTGAGQGYSNRLLVPLGENDSYTWTIPQAVFDKETPSFRVTLIGKGKRGENGANGETGTTASYNRPGKGGQGGEGGVGGSGGNILTVTMLATGLTEITVANDGEESVLTSLYYNYSSADGAPNTYGFFDPLSGEIFARKGTDGTAGARGGDGDWYIHTTKSPSTAEYGDDITYQGSTWYGGAPGGRVTVNGAEVGISPNMTINLSGVGGGGAAVGNNGKDATWRSRTDSVGGQGGAGRAGATVPATSYGFGGNGGFGGGGGGAGFDREFWNHEYASQIDIEYYGKGPGGAGGQGSDGAWGCAIIYW